MRCIERLEDSVKNFPYATYLMHVIEEVSGINFPKDQKHLPLRIKNREHAIVRREKTKLAKKQGASGASASTSRASPQMLPLVLLQLVRLAVPLRFSRMSSPRRSRPAAT